jgi:DNA polymerase-3 subunit epsilon
MESAAIKHHYPPYNRAQKRSLQPYGIFTYEDRRGILHLAYNKIKLVPNALLMLNNTTECRLYLEQLCDEFRLCAKYCHLQEQVVSCSHYKLRSCEGICRGDEPPEKYNEKVKKAVSAMTENNEDYLIREKGRKNDEDAVVLISKGNYYGYGFIPKETVLDSIEDAMAFIDPQRNTPDAKRLLQSYLIKNKDKEILLTPEVF